MSLPVWLPGLMFPLGGILGQGVSVQRMVSVQGGLGPGGLCQGGLCQGVSVKGRVSMCPVESLSRMGSLCVQGGLCRKCPPEEKWPVRILLIIE